MKTFLIIILLTTMLIFNGCKGTSPVSEDFIGKWGSNSGSSFIFKNDGTFTGQSIPADLIWMQDYKNQKLDGKGTWKIQKGQGSWEIYLSFDSTTISDLNDGFGSRLYISGTNGLLENKPPWYLFLWVEEEGGERYIFNPK